MQPLPFKILWSIWSKVALQSFGGPAGQIAVIHKSVVDDHKIISEERFLHSLNFCMLLPGPEAQQLATYMGWLTNGWRGGLIAGGLFILPGFLSILILSYLYVVSYDLTLVQGIFYGMKPAIMAIVLAALIRISKKALHGLFYWLMAIASFLALFVFDLPFPMVVISAGIAGVLYGKMSQPIPTMEPHFTDPVFPSWIKTFKTILIWLSIWLTPVFLILIIFGKDSNFHQLNLFFSKMSMVTFGGAYAALSYVAQRAVEDFGWLQGSEMLDGLGMAETTPGPLIQVVQFVGFLGSYRFPDLMAYPMLSAFIGSVLTTWMTFTPCFMWIFTFAPYVEYIRGKKIFSDALRAITAAVVGVIFNLSLWFMFQVLFKESQIIEYTFMKLQYPVFSTFDFFAGFIATVAMVLQFYYHQSLYMILGCSISLGTIGIYFL